MPQKKIPEAKTTNEHLPKQDRFFATTSLKRSARTGTQLPDPTQSPYGYDPVAQFRHLFPDLYLPILKTPSKYHPEDYVSFGHPELPTHELYLGDNLYLLRQLPNESVDLIYIDPPFFSNRDYVQIWGDDNEVRSFNDIFADGMFSYLAWLNARFWEMKKVLKPTGSIYVHCDWHASHYIKCELDKVFGYDNFQNEIVWYYRNVGLKVKANRFHNVNDKILWYKKGAKALYHEVKEPREKVSRQPLVQWDPVRKKTATVKDEQGNIIYQDLTERKIQDVWDIPRIAPTSGERLGYPTQKPEVLLQRIIATSSNEGDVVADFFMGGGTTGAAALRLGRRFIGCDISRVAVSVAASRLIDLGEEISGVTVTNDKPKTLGFTIKPMADIRVGYVGSYPVEKFKGISQEEFTKFVLDLYSASAFTSKTDFIHGVANGKLVISVGPGDPDKKVSVDQVRGLVEEVLRQFRTQLSKGEEKILQVIGWGFDPSIEIWKGQVITALNKENIRVQIELISLSSEAFRQKIFRTIGESNIDLKFNRLNQLLTFTASPYAGKIQATAQNGLKLGFRLEGAKAIGTGRLINCQWDFSYDGKRFASREHALNRQRMGQGDFEAVFDVENTFDKPGTYTIAARVQDNLDGEAVTTAQLTISEKEYKLQ